ncbi:SecY-interacting protein [Alkalimarinus sediminis]|uniref:SecY-interacting protein n=1 Tax=Alkalimarinus sediminis TaxID=1632866 RepID=A0A9E8KMC4_9ALTE|nr:SecY-interacting protein [Alkalimarinus sediminis]UZW73283.1 SecY-interacting protein [Alkalimarinus sediminis]
MTTTLHPPLNSDSTLPPAAEALEQLLQRFIELSHKLNLGLPTVEYDKNWLSECIIDEQPDEKGLVKWQPKIRRAEGVFSQMEDALGVKFHPDVIAFYTHFWSDGIVASHSNGEISLIQIWNSEDEDMLKQNLLGHAFAKQKNRLPLTLFIGCTYNDDIIAIDNNSGHVVLERPGFAPHETIANSISEFLNQLTPTLKPYNG